MVSRALETFINRGFINPTGFIWCHGAFIEHNVLVTLFMLGFASTLACPSHPGLPVAVMVVPQDKHPFPGVNPMSPQLFCRPLHLALLGTINLFRASGDSAGKRYFRFFSLPHLEMGSILCVHIYTHEHTQYFQISTCTGYIRGKILNPSVFCEQVGAIRNLDTLGCLVLLPSKRTIL